MRGLSSLFPRTPVPPREQPPVLSPAGYRGPSRDEWAMTEIALSLMGNVEPSDRALTGWAGWRHRESR